MGTNEIRKADFMLRSTGIDELDREYGWGIHKKGTPTDPCPLPPPQPICADHLSKILKVACKLAASINPVETWEKFRQEARISSSERRECVLCIRDRDLARFERYGYDKIMAKYAEDPERTLVLLISRILKRIDDATTHREGYFQELKDNVNEFRKEAKNNATAIGRVERESDTRMDEIQTQITDLPDLEALFDQVKELERRTDAMQNLPARFETVVEQQNTHRAQFAHTNDQVKAVRERVNNLSGKMEANNLEAKAAMDAFIKSVNTQGAQHLANQQHLEKRLNEIDNRAKAIQATQNSIQDAVNSLGELNDTHAVKLEAHRERISEVETWVKQVKDAMHTGEDAGDLLSREEIYAAFDEKIQKQANKDADARYEKHIRGLLEIQAKRIAALEAFVDKDLPVQVTSEIGNALDVPDQELKRIDQCLDQHMDHIRALQKQVNTAARELQQIRQSVPADSKATAEKIKRIQARLRKLEAIRTKKGN